MTAASLAAAWGGDAPTLVSERENAVYRVRLADGSTAALRLHRPGYQSAGAIRSELWWMERLSAAGMEVPVPLRTPAGEVLVEEGGRTASLVTWLGGRPLGSGDEALPGNPEVVAGRFRALGAAIAGMHDATDALVLPEDFERPRWDLEGLIGVQALWGQAYDNPALKGDERERLVEACAAGRRRLEAEMARGIDFGLIHADLLRENVLIDGNRIALIDFDDSGFGFRAYDLATALVQGLEDPMYGVAQEALFHGYSERRRVDAPPLGDVALFVALRCFASSGWAGTRVAQGDPRQRFYAERALRAAGTLTGA